MKKALIVVSCTLIYLLFTLTLNAQDNASILTYKQKLMQSNGLHMGLVGQILKTGLPYENQVGFHAETIENNNRMFVAASKKKITAGKTDSEPAVWDSWRQFSQRGQESSHAAGELAMAAESDIMSKMRVLGSTCGNCHKTFRKPKNARFMR